MPAIRGIQQPKQNHLLAALPAADVASYSVGARRTSIEATWRTQRAGRFSPTAMMRNGPPFSSIALPP